MTRREFGWGILLVAVTSLATGGCSLTDSDSTYPRIATWASNRTYFDSTHYKIVQVGQERIEKDKVRDEFERQGVFVFHFERVKRVMADLGWHEWNKRRRTTAHNPLPDGYVEISIDVHTYTETR